MYKISHKDGKQNCWDATIIISRAIFIIIQLKSIKYMYIDLWIIFKTVQETAQLEFKHKLLSFLKYSCLRIMGWGDPLRLKGAYQELATINTLYSLKGHIVNSWRPITTSFTTDFDWMLIGRRWINSKVEKF